MVMFFYSFTTTDSWSFVLLTGLKLDRESQELNYVGKHSANIDSLEISDLKLYFLYVFLYVLFLDSRITLIQPFLFCTVGP